MIRNSNRNISVAKGHGYTFDKVKYALDFVNKAGRNTTIEDWVAAYNYIKGTNEDAKGCKACKAAKFTAGVRNYAQYGYLTLLNEGYKQEDFLAEPSFSNDNVEVNKPEVVEEVVETQVDNEVVSTVTETADEGEPTVELPQPSKPVVRKKGGRPKKEVKK